jgi:hypothetical protein
MTVFFRPYRDITTAPSPRSESDKNLYDRISSATGLDIRIDPDVDYEDWIEPACMLDAAIDAGVEIHILTGQSLRRASLNPVAVINGTPCRNIILGRPLMSDVAEAKFFDLAWPTDCDQIVDHYAELDTFRLHAGRKLMLADMPGDRNLAGSRKPVFKESLKSYPLYTAMTEIKASTVIVKQVYPSKSLPLYAYDIHDDTTPKEAEDMFLDDVGYHFARFEGDPAALLVQEKILMTHETRFFIIDGKVVSGAACIEDHTPQQRPGNTRGLPPVWEVLRNSHNMDARTIDERKKTASMMWDFAVRVCAELAQEAPQLHSYVLDLALNADGDPIIIEFNPAGRSGLYASDTSAIVSAILEYAQNAPSKGAAPWDKDLHKEPPTHSNVLSRLNDALYEQMFDEDEDEDEDEDDTPFDDGVLEFEDGGKSPEA